MYIKVATAWLAKETAPSNIQQQLLTRALEIYQQLAQVPAEDVASRRDAAVAFERIGEIEHFLGHSDRAATALQQSIALEQSTSDSGDSSMELNVALAARHRKLANVQLTLARLNAARQSYTAGLHYAQSTADRDPAPLDHRLELALYRLLGSELARHAGSLEEAESLARRAAEELKALCREADDRLDVLVASLKAQLALTEVLRRLNRLDEAENAGEETLKSLTSGHTFNSSYSDARELVQLQAEAHDQLAAVLVDLRRPESAAEHLEQALALKQQNLKGRQRPMVFIVSATFYERFNFAAGYEAVPFCSYAESQFRLAEVLASLKRRDEAERLLEECMMMAYMLCSSQGGHDLRYMILFGRAWTLAADLAAANHPEDVVHLQNAADVVWQAVAAYFPQAVAEADVPREIRSRIVWEAELAAARGAVQANLYKNLPTTLVWRTAFVRRATDIQRYDSAKAEPTREQTDMNSKQ
jgi:tetratricopeptide (TPR) repeat protein